MFKSKHYTLYITAQGREIGRNILMMLISDVMYLNIRGVIPVYQITF